MLYLLSSSGNSEASDSSDFKEADSAQRLSIESHLGASEDEPEEEPARPVKQPCILVFDSLGGKRDRQARKEFSKIFIVLVFTSRRDSARPFETF